MRFFTKIIVVNSTIFLLSILVIEIIFGFWFTEHNFGPYMREHRLKNNPYVLSYEDKTYSYTYKRNYYGFRGEEKDLSEINAVIMGGSTIDERYKPEELTITGNLNTLLKKRGYNFQIINAGIEGQSTFGHIYNFKHWFPKLENFSPKLYIFYIGINDRAQKSDRKIEDNLGEDGHIVNPEKLEKFFDNLKSRSFFYDKLRILKHKYYVTEKTGKWDHNFFRGSDPSNYKYVNYDEALKIHDINNLKLKYKKNISNYLGRIEILNKYSKSNDAVDIYINQIAYEGIREEDLFIINYSLIEYCNKKNLYCIDLAKKFDGKLTYWYDDVHTTPLGSRAIAEAVIDDLVLIIKKEDLF